MTPGADAADGPFTFTINWGDGTPVDGGTATIDVAGSPGVPTAGSFDGSHTYADNGVYTVTVTVTAGDGRADTSTLHGHGEQRGADADRGRPIRPVGADHGRW